VNTNSVNGAIITLKETLPVGGAYLERMGVVVAIDEIRLGLIERSQRRSAAATR
jgi:hypothetical protein